MELLSALLVPLIPNTTANHAIAYKHTPAPDLAIGQLQSFPAIDATEPLMDICDSTSQLQAPETGRNVHAWLHS